MRVLMTTDTVGGVWQYSLALVRGLVEQHGCDVLLVCFGDPLERDIREMIPNGGVELVSLPFKLEWMPDALMEVHQALERIEKIAGNWQPDLVHGNQFCIGLLDVDIPKLLVAHSDVIGWFAWHRGQPRGTLSGVQLDDRLEAYRELVTSGLAGASAIVCPSHFMADSLFQTFGYRSRVIYNGLWADLYQHQTEKCDTAIVAGRLWDEAKGAMVAIQALNGLPLQLRLVGPTSGPSGETASIPTASNTVYIGSLPWKDTRTELARSRLYLATSTYEPFGLAALEAAFCGCALVASDIPSYREIWGEAALYFTVGDSSDLRSKLARLLETPGEIEKLAGAAHNRALDKYCAARMAAEYYHLYELLIDQYKGV
ncbi:MAG: glycosyltransferase family 4 protein [Chloroflexota bacterium]|jgi:glycogen(starch) synthase